MQKKESEVKGGKEAHGHNWVHFLVVLIIATVILLIFINGFSLGIGSAVSGGGSKKPDLVPYSPDMQYMYNLRLTDSKVLADFQVDASVVNVGYQRAKESVLKMGMETDGSTEGIRTAAFVVDVTGTWKNPQTRYYSISTLGTSIVIKVDPLKSNEAEHFGHYLQFLNVPVELPSPVIGTSSETRITFYSRADAYSEVSESDETNNYKSLSYIVHCLYDEKSPPPRPFCCVKRVDPLSTRYADVRYCEDFGIY